MNRIREAAVLAASLVLGVWAHGSTSGPAVVLASVDASGADNVVFALEDGTRRANLRSVSQDHDLEAVEVLSRRDQTFVAGWSDERSADTVAAELEADSRVAFAYPLSGAEFNAAPFGLPGWGTNGYGDIGGIGFYETGDDTVFTSLSSVSTLLGEGSDEAGVSAFSLQDESEVRAAHDATRGDGALVAILDTGVAVKHPILRSSFASKSMHYDFVDADATADEEYPGGHDAVAAAGAHVGGHGTFVAGLVHAVAPDATLLPVRVLNPYGVGEAADIIAGIEHAVSQGSDVIVIGMAGVDAVSGVTEAIKRAVAADVLVVAPAGNVAGAGVGHPAAESCTLAVAAAGAGGVPASFASAGPEVDMSAPGENLVSTLSAPGTANAESYATWSGSSFAAPIVAGQAALLRSLDPDLSVRAMTAIMAQTATPLSLSASEQDLFGAGLPHLARSVYFHADGHETDLTRSPIDPACTTE